MNYTIKRSKRRSVSIEITRDAKIVVHAPIRMAQKTIDDFVNKNELWIISHLENRIEKNKRYPELNDEEKENYRTLAKEIIPQKVEYFAKIMGVLPKSVSINSAKTRFGSCSYDNRLNFSLYLMRYPNDAIDYVVVHELAHIKHHNHSRGFWAFVADYMPDYKERKKLLK